MGGRVKRERKDGDVVGRGRRVGRGVEKGEGRLGEGRRRERKGLAVYERGVVVGFAICKPKIMQGNHVQSLFLV